MTDDVRIEPGAVRDVPVEALVTLHRKATLGALDEDAQTVDALISTGAGVARLDSRGRYVERLDLSAVDPQSLVDLPVLDGHRHSASRDVVGIVTAARREAEGIVATIRLSQADDVADVRLKIREGVLRAVSIGYGAASTAETVEGGQRVRTIVPKIREVSVVAIGADPRARILRGVDSMDNEITTEAAADRTEVRRLARNAGLGAEWADDLIDREATMTQVRAAAFEELQARPAPRIRTHAAANDPVAIRTRRAEALVCRMSGAAPEEAVRPYMGDRLVDHARACVEAAGISTHALSVDELLHRALHTTSDFPALLQATGNRTLMAAYEAARSPLQTALARQTTLPDFRSKTATRLGGIGKLSRVDEHGEIPRVTRDETGESYRLDTYGSIFGLTRQAIVNDDLGAFGDWGRAAGTAAAHTVAQLLAGIVVGNPTMGDGVAMFDADHGNIGAGTAPDTTKLSAARLALRSMTGLDGQPIDVRPRYLAVSADLETTAETLLATIYPATTGEVNPFAGRLELLVEPRLPSGAWYVFADPASTPVIEYAYLAGQQGPQLSTREGWDVLGMEFRVVLDVGAGAVDWRGAYKG